MSCSTTSHPHRCAILFGLLACVAAAGCNRDRGADDAPSSRPSGERRVVALGRLEPAGGIISISALPGERLKGLAPGVDVGANVLAGAELGWVSSFDLRKTQLKAVNTKLNIAKRQRQHERAVAQVQVKQAMAGKAQAEAKRDEVEAQRRNLENLAEAAAIAVEDYQRLEQLQSTDPELVTDHQLRRQRNLSDRAQNEYEATAAAFPPALTAAEKAVEAAAANVELAERNLQMAEEVDQTLAVRMERKVAEESLDQSVLRAPTVEGGSTNFTVLQILMQPGEIVTQLPVLEIADVSRMVTIAEVYEADAKEILPGQMAMIRSPAFAGQFSDDAKDGGGMKGKVTRVGSMIASPGLTNRNPLAPSDRSVVEVEIEITDPQAIAEASQRIGLQVTVEFDEKSAQATASEKKADESRPVAATP